MSSPVFARLTASIFLSSVPFSDAAAGLASQSGSPGTGAPSGSVVRVAEGERADVGRTPAANVGRAGTEDGVESGLPKSDDPVISFASFDLTLYAPAFAAPCGTIADPDCDEDGIPDSLEADCNGNGIPDDCEAFADCNANGVPDECDPDSNGNGVPDDCEPVDSVAEAESSTRGFVSGAYPDTHAGDGITEAIQEEESNGSPNKRRSLLQHQWTFNVPPSSSTTFFVRAHHSPSVDGDDFVFSCATPGNGFVDLLTVTKTADDGMYQSAILPDAVSGTVYVQVLDTDRRRGNRDLDTIFVDEMFIRGSSTTQPPSAPSDLTATAESSTWIDLSWSDTSDGEQGFEIERSTGGAPFALVDTVGSDVNGYLDTGLLDSTNYSYRVRASSAEGFSSYSNVASASTPSAGAIEDVASGEATLAGDITRGDFVDTGSGNQIYEEIREERSGGPRSSRVNSLEHIWTIDVQGGTSAELHVKAHHTANGEGDDFAFAWSADGVTFADLLTVTKTSDDGTYQVAALPPLAAGDIQVRVRDTDRTPGRRGLDTIFVDHIFVRYQ